MPPYVRQDIWALEQAHPWHPITQAYALAVGVMQTRAANDPTSWQYQADVHGMVNQPPAADQYRAQCQHGTWFFLPWHRHYLYWFERMVRSAVQSLPTVDDATKAAWALPYWNYSNGAPTNTLPAPFRQPQMPDGQPNPLFVQDRAPNINAGGAIPRLITSLVALEVTAFTDDGDPGGTAGFGGPTTGWQHVAQTDFGALENTPHNGVHDQVGGLMGSPDTAAADPIFWLHHTNIDRLWSVWIGQAGGRQNPADGAWTGHQFQFHDEQGNPTTGTPAGALDTVAGLGYTYG